MSTNFADIDIIVRSDSVRNARNDIDDLADNSEDAGRRVRRSSNVMEGGFNRVRSALLGLAAMIGGVFAATKAIEDARKFSAAMAEASTLIDGTAQQMAFLEESARSMAREFGGSGTQQVQAFYQAISAGAGSVENAANILDSANRLAIGGVTSVVVAVDALTTATNAYAASGLTASDASDAMFVAIKAGKTTAGELGSALGNVVPIASALGVEFDELLAATAALTTQGQTTAMAVTGLRAVLSSVLRPSKEAQDASKAMGLEFTTAALRARGLQGFLDDVIVATGGSETAMASLFPSIEALNAVLSFAGGAGDAFASTMDGMAEKAGATQEAFEKINESLAQRFNVQMAILGDLALSLGQVLLAAAVPALEALTGVLMLAVEHSHELQGMFLVAAATLVTIYAPAMYGLVVAAYAAIAAFVTFKGVLLATGIGAFVVLAGLLVGKFLELAEKAGGFGEALGLLTDIAKEVWERIPIGASLMVVNLQMKFNDMLTRWTKAVGTMLGVWNTFVDSVAGTKLGSLAGIEGGNFIAGTAETAASVAKLDAEFADLVNRSVDLQNKLTAPLASLKALSDVMNGTGEAAGVAASETEAMAAAIAAALSEIPANTPETPDGSGGGAGDVVATYAERMLALLGGLEGERAVKEEWYLDAQAILADQRAEELLGTEAHQQALAGIEMNHLLNMQALKDKARSHELSAQQGMYSDLAGLLSMFGGKSRAAAIAAIGINTALRVSEIIQNTAAAQMRAFAELGPIAGAAAAAKIAVYGKIQAGIAIAAGALRASQSGGGGTPGAVATGGAVSEAAGPSSAAGPGVSAMAPQEIRVTLLNSGQGRFVDDLIFNAAEQIFDAVMGENRNRNFVLRTERGQ